MDRIRVIDSHTGGERTRVVLDGGPDLGARGAAACRDALRERHDWLRSAVILEPRGSEDLVGALLVPPAEASSAAAVVFFNNVGYLGMCGHGMIGVARTLEHLGRIGTGRHRIETPVGTVAAEVHEDRTVSIENVPSRREARGVDVDVAGAGRVRGDVAWGGNWFFLVSEGDIDWSAAGAGGRPLPMDLSALERWTDLAWRIRAAVNASGWPQVDHVEVFGPPRAPGARARCFVLCPGKAYDRSPCGTGTSAKLACLAADGALAEGEEWVQESVIGSRFRARYRWLSRERGEIVPTVTGSAHITAEAVLLFEPEDPFRLGIG